ncbi:heterokaryon incompatibility protein-domain-containing protein [Fusarium solani]|uniref:Heterokaryon incompatibility protein-domain-containing protein n=1 Tax=Fusarium solani TaxID=169388 RepID=A0A9P9KKE7_FUSSL|nr:heterokaryon incompatibility protein-domain-containing protein [Fusarium solani]KAH7260400.1 heterokaryon incompatibility protein-domain-containing protein [Fusarium solani]
MTRWHPPSCQSPIVWVGEDSVPRCKACGASAHEQLQQLREHPSNPVSPLPPDEKAGQLNLHWPSSVSYTREKTAALTEEIRDCLQISGPPSRTQKSLIHGRTLERDEFRLICLTAEEKDLPADVVRLSLETYNDGNFPDYEAVSYTWGGEDGDDTLRHPIYIGEHWDILLQTRNCCAMLRYLRPSRGIRMVWVDAICINQEDMQERGDQIAKMGQLFTRCFQVFLWLGDDIVFKKPGVHPPRLPLHELEHLEELQLPSKTEPVNIRSLFERRYFSRVWIIQELILPPRIAIPIGDKIFWADPSTPTHFERLSSRDWLWEQTRAPWFQHATRGSVMQENLSEFMTLTWKSQSSDIRDKVYGVMGLSSMKEGAQIRPDYGISLQHLIIGFFAHGIISGGAPQLLLKAAGTSAEAGMPSWMPHWRGDAWEELFGSNDKENPAWENVENSLVEVKRHRQKPGPTTTRWKGYKQYRLVRFLPGSFFEVESELRKTVFDRRPWHQNATVDADTGAMSLNLTRLASIKNRPARLRGFGGERWYRINNTREFSCEDVIFVMSRSKLDEVVEAGDEIFLLDTNVRAPIYMILRKTGNPREFRLIAACPHLAFLLMTKTDMPVEPVKLVKPVPSCEPLPLGDLQHSLHEDLTILRIFYDHEVSGIVFNKYQGIRKRFLFPGKHGPVTFKEVLPLLFGLARDKHKQKFKSWRGFQELYLESIDPKFQPRVSNGFCELSLAAEDKEEIVNLLDYHAYGVEMKGWSKGTDKEGTGRVVLRRNISVIGPELRTMVSNSYPLNLAELVDSLVGRLEDADVGERIMAGPVEEDHRGGTHFWLDPVLERFGLDGSTFRVRII